jgi:rhodanese-related sulfurtransferase
MKRFLVFTSFLLVVVTGNVAWSYDAELARSYERLFSNVSGADAGKAMHFLSPEAFINDMHEGKEYVAIDVRTPAEARLFTLSLPNSLVIPTSEVFTPENLATIPTDKPVVIICKSGARATAVGTALRHIGFDDVFILKGGFQGLAGYYGPKQAYPAPAASGK